MKKNIRIIERVRLDGRVEFVIQKRLCLFGFFWIDGFYVNEFNSSFATLEEARDNVKYFDGSKPVERVVEEL